MENKTLTIRNHSSSHINETSTTFLRLDVDILLLIIEEISRTTKTKSDLLSLCLTCRALLNLTRPYLFQSHCIVITVTTPGAILGLYVDPKTLSFHRSLSDNASLRSHVRCLTMNIIEPCQGNFRSAAALEEALKLPSALDLHPDFIHSKEWSVLADIFTWATNVRNLSMHHQDLSSLTSISLERKLCLYIPEMKRLESLELLSSTFVQTPSVVSTLLLPQNKLKILKLNRFKSRWQGKRLELFLPPSSDHARDVFKNLEELHIGDDCIKWDWIDFLPFCKNLHTIKWIYFKPGYTPVPTKPGYSLQDALLCLTALRELILIFNRHPSLVYNDMRSATLKPGALPGLEKLTLDGFLFNNQTSPSSIYESFFSPNLQSLRWDMKGRRKLDMSVSRKTVAIMRKAIMMHEKLRFVDIYLTIPWEDSKRLERVSTEVSRLRRKLSYRKVQCQFTVERWRLNTVLYEV